MRYLLAALLCIAALQASAQGRLPKSTTFSADLSGLWWNAAESGWGLNLIQQDDTLFATLFLYGADNKPLWLVAPATTFTGEDTGAAYNFHGPLFRTSGPAFAGAFNPAQVGVTQVGTLTVRAITTRTMIIDYVVDGVRVVKNLVPQQFREPFLAGNHSGVVHSPAAVCAMPVPTPGSTLLGWNISQSGMAVTITVTDALARRCTMSGTIAAGGGKLVDVQGTYSCTNGNSGTFLIGRMEAGADGISGLLYSQATTGCAANGATFGMALTN